MPSLLPLCILVIFVAVLSTTAPGTSKVSHPNKNICLWQKCANLGYSQPWRVLQEGNTGRVCRDSSKKWGKEKRRWGTKEMSQASMQAEIPSEVAQTVLLNCSALNKLDADLSDGEGKRRRKRESPNILNIQLAVFIDRFLPSIERTKKETIFKCSFFLQFPCLSFSSTEP